MIEGDVLPFKMTKAQRQLAIEKLAGGPTYQTPEYDGVQLFRAKRLEAPPKPSPAPKGPRTRTRKCHACGNISTVKVAPLPFKRRAPPRQKRWFLYYGPDRMTGGFLTKQEARNWYLNGGR